ncbi:MAG: serine/threonine protein kinase [Gemmatimonadota bacterium]|nr:MAG: serine/threonine protein kinase [Gemmatimonadota bacterium]
MARLPDRYEIEGELGRGGMATVYLVRDAKHGRRVAIKVLLPDLAAAVGSERFLREIEITAQLNHPHILPLLDSGATDGLLYYVMPYVSGGSLRRYLRGDERLSLETVLRVTREVASALDYAHGRGVLHRDIKPENILFSEGLAVVADFGIARALTGTARAGLTRTGIPVGTPGYMSPEQALGTGALDARTDVYSLGCVVYEMLVGSTPASWPGTEDVRLGRLNDVPPEHRLRLDALPGRMEQVLTKALALRPGDRFARAGELADALIAASERTPSLSPDEVRRLIDRAAELQAQNPTEEGALSLGAVEQLAAEVGIPPEHVRSAARELQRSAEPASVSRVPQRASPAPVSKPRYAPSAYDARKGRIALERTVEGEIPESAYAGLVEEIQSRLDSAGHASMTGRTLTWSPAAQGEATRKVVVTVTPRDGQTYISVEERLELTGLKKIFLPIGGMTAGLMALPIVEALSAEPLAPILAIAAGLGGVFLAAKWVNWFDALDREPELEKLADRLAARAAEAVRPALGPYA